MINLKKKFDVVTVGGATRDIMFYSGDGELVKTGNLTKQKLLAFEYGAKILADKVYFSFGGGAANTAVSFAKLGLKTGVICRIDNRDNGKDLMMNFKKNGVDTSLIKIDKKEHAGFSVIITIDNAEKEHIVFGYRGTNDKLNENDIPLDRISPNWIYVSSLPKVGWLKIMTKLVNAGKNLVWNPGSRQLSQLPILKKLLPKVKVLILNHDEALEFKKLKNTKGLLKYIKSLGSEMVVMTDGDKGAYVYDGHKYYFMKAKKVKSADTVGVGDAFGSAFVAALIYGKNIKEALKWGINNSASTIKKVGAQNGLLTKKQVSS